ncbi:MAG: polysaccharide deacetylase family protein [Terricaulis sp.]
MIKFFAGALALILCAAPASAQTIQWPGGQRAAIALTYDDALKSQLDVAIPQLDAVGLKGTFFLMGRQIGAEIPRWRAAAAEGHELGNHTVNHPCARGTYEMAEQYTSEAYNVEVLINEIGVMNNLVQALDGKTTHAFATPCGQTRAGGADYIDALQRSGYAPFVRNATGGNERGFDPFNVPGQFFPDDVTGAQLIAYVEGVRQSGGYAVLGFHGVGGDYLSVSADAHRELVTYLKAHEREIWTAPFSDVLAVVQATRPR